MIIKRRDLIALAGGAMIAGPRVARAQKMPRLGILYPGGTDIPSIGGFFEGLQSFGYREGQTIAIERRFANWNPARFSELADELVRLKVDVIVIFSSSPAQAAKPPYL